MPARASIADENEGGPIRRMRIGLCARRRSKRAQPLLCFLKCLCLWHAFPGRTCDVVAEPVGVETLHQERGRAVIHPPKADQDTPRACHEERVCDGDVPFAPDTSADRRAAGTQRHESGIDGPCLDFRCLEEAIARLDPNLRQHQRRAFRGSVVDERMSCKVKGPDRKRNEARPHPDLGGASRIRGAHESCRCRVAVSLCGDGAR